MEKLRVLLVLLGLSHGAAAAALNLKYVAEASLANDLEYQGTRVGGLSSLLFSEGSLYAVSDDRGKFAEPRFYKFQFGLQGSKITFKPEGVFFVKDLPGQNKSLPKLDLEGQVRLPDGSFILSSEGNNNSKPREMPLLFQVSAEGKWKSNLQIPDQFMPEATGKQTKGIQNNSAFEGLTLTPSGKTLWAAAEAPLVQDILTDPHQSGLYVRFIQFDQDTKNNQWNQKAQYAYRLDDLSKSDLGVEVFRGVSEVLAISENQLLVLERGVRVLTKNLMNVTAAIYVVNTSAATDIQKATSLSLKDLVPLKKTKLLDFETDLKVRGEKKVQNFEALAWGPTLPDGRKTLLVLSDNNFSKKEITELIVFAVEPSAGE